MHVKSACFQVFKKDSENDVASGDLKDIKTTTAEEKNSVEVKKKMDIDWTHAQENTTDNTNLDARRKVGRHKTT